MGWNHQLVSQKRYLFQIMIPEFWYFFRVGHIRQKHHWKVNKPPNFTGIIWWLYRWHPWGGKKLESFLGGHDSWQPATEEFVEKSLNLTWIPAIQHDWHHVRLHPRKLSWNPEMMIWKMFFLLKNGWFWGSMLNFGGVCPFYQASSTSSIGSFLNVCFTEGETSRPFFLLWNSLDTKAQQPT